MCGGAPSAPAPPPPPPAPPQAAPVKQVNEGTRRRRREERRRASNLRGSRSTIATSPRGLLTGADAGGSTSLLGG